MEKMFKYKMVTNNKCKRCGEIETYKHLLWECREAKKIWQSYNDFLTHVNKLEDKIMSYDNIFRIGNIGYISKVKIRVIQGMIQIERPVNWSIDNIKKLAKEIENIESYNANRAKIAKNY